jgi:hypothetical protein
VRTGASSSTCSLNTIVSWFRNILPDACSLLVKRDGDVYDGEEDCADYDISSLHEMITVCPKPYNDAYILKENP